MIWVKCLCLIFPTFMRHINAEHGKAGLVYLAAGWCVIQEINPDFGLSLGVNTPPPPCPEGKHRRTCMAPSFFFLASEPLFRLSERPLAPLQECFQKCQLQTLWGGSRWLPVGFRHASEPCATRGAGKSVRSQGSPQHGHQQLLCPCAPISPSMKWTLRNIHTHTHIHHHTFPEQLQAVTSQQTFAEHLLYARHHVGL